MTDYRVLVGLNYPPDDTRAEPGDVLPAGFVADETIARLVAEGIIAEDGAQQPDVTTTAESSLPEQGPTEDPSEPATDAVAAVEPSTEPEPPTTPTEVPEGAQAPVEAAAEPTPADAPEVESK